MKKLKLRSWNHRGVWVDMVNKISEGWKVIKEPKKNFWGIWTCKLEKL